MKKLIALILSLTFILTLVGCSQAEEKQQGDPGMQYFFSGKVIEVTEEYLLIEVNDTGNTNLSDGTKVEVSTEVISADGCPDFVVDEYARVLMARNTDDNSPGRLEALSIYKTDETGMKVAEDRSVDLERLFAESWSGTITNIFTEGAGADLAEVIELEIENHDPMYFTLVEDTEYQEYYTDNEKVAEITKDDLYIGAWVEIDCKSYNNSGYHPITVIKVIKSKS